MLTQSQRHQRARLAALQRHRPDSIEATEAARDFAADRLADYVAHVLAEAPPLTDEQRDRLSLLLAGGLDGAA